jgi:hypothetical protein
VRQPPPSPRPAPVAPQSNYPVRPQYLPQHQTQPSQATPMVSQSNGNINFSVNPSQIATAFNAASSLMNNMNLVNNQNNRPSPGTNGFT